MLGLQLGPGNRDCKISWTPELLNMEKERLERIRWMMIFLPRLNNHSKQNLERRIGIENNANIVFLRVLGVCFRFTPLSHHSRAIETID